jgi:hypothetical protein
MVPRGYQGQDKQCWMNVSLDLSSKVIDGRRPAIDWKPINVGNAKYLIPSEPPHSLVPSEDGATGVLHNSSVLHLDSRLLNNWTNVTMTTRR